MMTDTRDTVLAYFKGTFGEKYGTIRLVKRNGEFYMKGDIPHNRENNVVKVYEDRIRVTRSDIIEKIRLAFEQTMSGEDDCSEIWINSYIYHHLWDKD